MEGGRSRNDTMRRAKPWRGSSSSCEAPAIRLARAGPTRHPHRRCIPCSYASSRSCCHWRRRCERTIPTRVGRTCAALRASPRAADHPHAGGENMLAGVSVLGLPGPSSRGWGERCSIQNRRSSPRTIPTRVGRTGGRRARFQLGPDHPHAGGENESLDGCGSSASGPSPRGWGEHMAVVVAAVVNRTIPTRVGRTSFFVAVFHRFTDHPHAGGENLIPTMILNTLPGPSPRGWGEPELAEARALLGRTIPTRVGRTARGSQSAGSIADHPHAGGENLVAKKQMLRHCGPSPRGWGERAGVVGVVFGFRTIPTRVGRTVSMSCAKISRAGPSPRGWGELIAWRDVGAVRRTIPTRVGRTRSASA